MTANVVCVHGKLTITAILPLLAFLSGKILPNRLHDLALEGVALSEGLRRLHAKDADGQLKVGVDAFILIWKQLKRWRILGFFVGLPIIRQIAKVVYGLFADWRFKRLEHCQLSLEKDSL